MTSTRALTIVGVTDGDELPELLVVADVVDELLPVAEHVLEPLPVADDV